MAGKIIKGEALSAPEGGLERPSSSPRQRPAAVMDAGVYTAHQEAKQIVDEARAEAARIREEAERDKAALHEKARQEGHAEGLAQAAEVVAKARCEHGELLAGAENELIKLSVKVAEKIIGRELALDPETIVLVCAQAIENLRAQRELVVRINPEDAAILKNNRKRLMDMLGRVKDLAIKEDAEVARGGCIIEAESGATIDAQLATQLEMLQRVFLGEEEAAGFAKGKAKP